MKLKHILSLDQIQQSGVIRIAHRDASIPFSYVLAKDQAPVGFAIDICLKLQAVSANN